MRQNHWRLKLGCPQKEAVGHGYHVDWREVKSRTLGRNLFPQRVTFETREDLLRFVGREREFNSFSKAVEQLRARFPQLASWIQANLRMISEAAEDLNGLLAVLEYFVTNSRPGCFARELPVCVDTKFVERHQPILRQWFDIVLPSHAIRADESQFELRYGLRYVEPEVFIRIADRELQGELGLPVEALSLPIHALGRLDVKDIRVIIVENKVNVLTMPLRPRTLVIGGLGNGCVLLRHVPWLAQVPITYWGDVDIEGIEILCRLRRLFPQVQSVTMDAQALHRWSELVGRGNGRKLELPPLLTPGEAEAFHACSE